MHDGLAENCQYLEGLSASRTRSPKEQCPCRAYTFAQIWKSSVAPTFSKFSLKEKVCSMRGGWIVLQRLRAERRSRFASFLCRNHLEARSTAELLLRLSVLQTLVAVP